MFKRYWSDFVSGRFHKRCLLATYINSWRASKSKKEVEKRKLLRSSRALTLRSGEIQLYKMPGVVQTPEFGYTQIRCATFERVQEGANKLQLCKTDCALSA